MGFSLGPKATAGGYRLQSYDTIGSTSTEALDRARAGEPGRLWVVSKRQTAGHGRRGRSWETPDGNLAASLLLRHPGSPAEAATLGFVAGLAVFGAISAVAKVGSSPAERGRGTAEGGGGGNGKGSICSRPLHHASHGPPPPWNGGGSERLRLKWPNDVLVDGAKVAGILLEAVSGPEGSNGLVIGIGINVQHAPQGLPYATTSLAACGAETDAEELFEALAECWIEQERLWDGGKGFADIRENWLKRAAGLGGPIAVRHGENVIRGTFETIDETGMLVVRAPDGATRTIAAGEVHFGAAATMSAA